MNEKITTSARLEYQLLFDGDIPQIEDLLASISQTSAINIITALLHKDYFALPLHIQHQDILEMLDDGDMKLYNSVASKLQRSKEWIFEPNVLLNLLERVIGLNLKQNVQTDLKQDFLIVLKLILILNKEKNHIDDSDKMESLSNDADFLRFYIKHFLAQYEIQRYNIKKELYVQTKKFLILKNFLKGNELGKDLLEEIRKKYVLQHFNQYFYKIFSIIGAYIEARYKNNMIAPEIDFSSAEDISIIPFFDGLCINGKAPEFGIHYKSIREYPLLKTVGQNYKILYFPFLIDKIFKSFYFIMNDAFRSSSHLVSAYPKLNFKSFLGNNFTEKYLLKSVLTKIFEAGRKYMFVDPEGLKNIKGSIPDFIYIRGNTVFVFECKDNLIDGRLKENLLYYQIDDLINKAFVKSDSRDVGAVQILNFINNNIKALAEMVKLKGMQKMVLYPVIVISDKSFNTPGINKYLNHLISDRLKTISDRHDIIIENVMLTSIDHLLQFESVFASNLDLGDVVKAYFRFVTSPKNRTV